MSITRPKIRCDECDFCKEDLGDPCEQIFNENSRTFKEETLSFLVEKEVFYQRSYTKFLVDLANVDVVIEEEDKVLILLSSLPDEGYETFILT